jgi:hypothetical protein
VVHHVETVGVGKGERDVLLAQHDRHRGFTSREDREHLLGDALTQFVCSRRDARTEAALRPDSNDRLPRTTDDIFLHPETAAEVRTEPVV